MILVTDGVNESMLYESMPNALNKWKLSIFKIIDKRIEFYSQNTNRGFYPLNQSFFST